MNEGTKENAREQSRDRIHEKIRIVEYQEHHAQSLAEMWNASKEEWGGQDGNRTAEQVKSSIRNEGNLKDFVALEGETVIGYCSFTEYEEDEGASYIPMLNVRPEYHGKKIGKKLLLKALETAVEQQWPRMDLYTWSSNLKAVPLYKKCGFFWEKDHPYIHLMNFMPTVLNTEAITSYFKDLHWYDHGARELEVEPDGREEKGFHFYEYLWKNGKETLRAEFCRRGRGLRLIDNKDYKVECYTEKSTFAFGKSYPVYYRIINRTDQPLQIQLQGRDDKNIRYTFQGTYEVSDEKIIEGEFFLEEIKELYPELLTHPAIITDMIINGKKAEFKLGIVPKFPLDLGLEVPHKESFVGRVEKGYLDMENGFEEEIRVSFDLEDGPELQWEASSIALTLKPREKKSLPVFFRVKKLGFYQKRIRIHIKLPKEELTFQKEIKSFIRGRRGKFYGETDKAYSVVNGSYKLTLEKHENHLMIEDLRKPGRDEICYPKLGIPFNTDFSSKLPEEATYHMEEESIILRGIFHSKALPGIRLHSVSELYADGIVKQHYEVENTTAEKNGQDIWVSTALYHRFADSFLSYDHNILQVAGMEESGSVYYDVNKFTENWVYARVGPNSWGMVWPKDIKLERDGPFLKVNENLGVIDPGDRASTKPVFMLYNTMSDWKELRRFARGNEELEHPEEKQPRRTFEVRVNNHNPFVASALPVTLEENKEDHLSGKITVTSDKESIKPMERTYKDSEEIKSDNIISEIFPKEPRDTLRITADLKKTRKSFEKKIFILGKNSIEKTMESSKLKKEDLRRDQKIQEGKIYKINNGLLSFSCDPDYSNGLWTLNLEGKEYLDGNYPKYASKFPFNPWAGGSNAGLDEYELEAVLREKRSAKFVTKMDNKGNPWEGIMTATEIQGIEKYKGLRLNQYFLTLPGIPVLVTLLEIVQETRGFCRDLRFYSRSYFRLEEELSQTYFAKDNELGERIEFKAGKYLVLHNAKDKFLEIGSRKSPEKVVVYAPKAEHMVGFTNKELLEIEVIENISLGDKSTKALDPVFMIFSKKEVSITALEDLKHIRF